MKICKKPQNKIYTFAVVSPAFNKKGGDFAAALFLNSVIMLAVAFYLGFF